MSAPTSPHKPRTCTERLIVLSARRDLRGHSHLERLIVLSARRDLSGHSHLERLIVLSARRDLSGHSHLELLIDSSCCLLTVTLEEAVLLPWPSA